MDYNFLLDREWRALNGQNSSEEEGKSHPNRKRKMPRKNKNPRKMCPQNTEEQVIKNEDGSNLSQTNGLVAGENPVTSEQTSAQLPIPSPQGPQATSGSGDVHTTTIESSQDPHSNPPAPAADQPVTPTEEELKAAKEARSKALNEELVKLMKAVPDSFYPVPEEFQPMLDQLDWMNDPVQPRPIKFQFVAEPIYEDHRNNTGLSYNSGLSNGWFDGFRQLPHQMVNYSQNQYTSMMTIQNQAAPAQPYNAVNELCAVMSEYNPWEGPSTSGYQYAQANVGIQYQGVPVLFQQDQYQQNVMMMGQMSQMILPHMTIHMSTPVVLHTPTLRQLLSPTRVEIPAPQPAPMQPQQPQQPQAYQPTQAQTPQPHNSQNQPQQPPPPTKDSPRELRNRAEKQRRDKLNQSIALLNKIVPPVVAMGRKIDKTTIMKLTAHYLRSHQYVFGNSIYNGHTFNVSSVNALLSLLKGFVLTVTYRGIIVVVSHNIRTMLGYSELDLVGTNVFSLVHEQDHEMFRDHLTPRSVLFGKHGELLIPDEPDGAENVAIALAKEKKAFVLRFKKLVHRSEPPKYMTCHVEGSFRKSDRACRLLTRCCQLVRRARARGENPRSSGNDVVFVGVVRPLADTFMSESVMESFRMEYRTRHSVDGEIIQCEQRIALVTGYMTHEVSGINAMNFMHRDDVRWVIVALREMYDQHRLFGESCYRLMTKNGEFVYMRSRGRLDVDATSKIATSFVCTNTVVDEEEGKHFINQMKKRFTILVENGPNSLFARDENQPYDEDCIPVEDPRLLEKVILHLVTNLPSPNSRDSDSEFSNEYQRVSIIPPKKDRIVNAIKRIENVLHPRKLRAASMEEYPRNDRLEDNNNKANAHVAANSVADQAQLGVPTTDMYRQPSNSQPQPQINCVRTNVIQSAPMQSNYVPTKNSNFKNSKIQDSARSSNYTAYTQRQADTYRAPHASPTSIQALHRQAYATPANSSEAFAMISAQLHTFDQPENYQYGHSQNEYTDYRYQYEYQSSVNFTLPHSSTYSWGDRTNVYDQPSTSSGVLNYNSNFCESTNYNTVLPEFITTEIQWLEDPFTFAVDDGEINDAGIEIDRLTPFLSDSDSTEIGKFNLTLESMKLDPQRLDNDVEDSTPIEDVSKNFQVVEQGNEEKIYTQLQNLGSACSSSNTQEVTGNKEVASDPSQPDDNIQNIDAAQTANIEGLDIESQELEDEVFDPNKPESWVELLDFDCLTSGSPVTIDSVLLTHENETSAQNDEVNIVEQPKALDVACLTSGSPVTIDSVLLTQENETSAQNDGAANPNVEIETKDEVNTIEQPEALNIALLDRYFDEVCYVPATPTSSEANHVKAELARRENPPVESRKRPRDDAGSQCDSDEPLNKRCM